MLWVRAEGNLLQNTVNTVVEPSRVVVRRRRRHACGRGRGPLLGRVFFFFFYPSASVGGFSAAGTGGGAKGGGLVEVPSSGRKDEPSEKSSSEVESWLV